MVRRERGRVFRDARDDRYAASHDFLCGMQHAAFFLRAERGVLTHRSEHDQAMHTIGYQVLNNPLRRLDIETAVIVELSRNCRVDALPGWLHWSGLLFAYRRAHRVSPVYELLYIV